MRSALRNDPRSSEAAAYRRLYRTARWRKLRLVVLAERPLCEWCLEQDIVTEATEVHHHGAHRGDEERFWSGPFVTTCKSCHASRGQREDLGQKVKVFGLDGYPIE